MSIQINILDTGKNIKEFKDKSDRVITITLEKEEAIKIANDILNKLKKG